MDVLDIPDILDIVLANSRTPREREGDLNAQFATNVIGARRVEEIFGRFGTDTALAGIDTMLDASEARTQAGIAALRVHDVAEHRQALSVHQAVQVNTCRTK